MDVSNSTSCSPHRIGPRSWCLELPQGFLRAPHLGHGHLDQAPLTISPNPQEIELPMLIPPLPVGRLEVDPTPRGGGAPANWERLDATFVRS